MGLLDGWTRTEIKAIVAQGIKEAIDAIEKERRAQAYFDDVPALIEAARARIKKWAEEEL